MTEIDRRAFLAALGSSSLSMSSGGVDPAWGKVPGGPEDSIGAFAAAAGIAFGTCIEKEVFEDAGYDALVRKECRMLVDATSLTFGYVRPDGPNGNFWAADRLLAYAESHKIPFYGTTLIWNDYLPDWIKAKSRAEAAQVFDAHIDETVKRYAGRIQTWTVVNEPFAPWDHQPHNFRKGPWYNAFGGDYIARALRRAAAADPHAKLMVNEAFCERNDDLGQTVRKELLPLVKRLRDAAVPLNAIGLQGHLQPQFPYDDQIFARFLSDLADEGVELQITEFDVDDSSFPDDVGKRDAAVAKRYRDFLTAVMDVPALKVVNMWGLADRYTWYRDVARQAGTLQSRPPRPLPFDEALSRKDAWYAMADVFAARAGRAPD